MYGSIPVWECLKKPNKAKLRLAFLEFYQIVRDVSVVCRSLRYQEPHSTSGKTGLIPIISKVLGMLKIPKTKRQGILTLEEEFIKVNEYFEEYLTDTALTKANRELTKWLIFYNYQRPHQALNYLTPM